MIGLPSTLAALLPLAAGEPPAPSTADAPKPAPVIVIMDGDPGIPVASNDPHTLRVKRADVAGRLLPGPAMFPPTPAPPRPPVPAPPQPIAISPLAANDDASDAVTVQAGDAILRAEHIAIAAEAPAAVAPLPPNPPAPVPPPPVTPSVASVAPRADQAIVRAAHVSLTTAPADDEAPVTLRIEDQPLREVMATLREATGRNIVLDPEALAERGVTPETRVSVSTKGVRLEVALRAMLKPLGLECRREQDHLLVTSIPRDGLITQTYYVADLIGAKPTAEEFNAFAESIREIVAPGTWKPAEGAPAVAAGQVGSITPFFLNVSLIVRHDEAAHKQVQTLLRTLRDVQDKAGKAE